MFRITKVEITPNPANRNSAVKVAVTVKEIDQQAKFPLKILKNLGVYFGLKNNKRTDTKDIELENGENRLIITVYNKNGLSTVARVKSIKE